MCIIHRWTKWQDYDAHIPARQLAKNWGLSPATEHRQFRVCEKCGKKVDRLVNITAHI